MKFPKYQWVSEIIGRALIAGIALIFGGALLAFKNIAYYQTSCWGHMGCDYYDRDFNLFGYVGLAITAAGAILFCKGLLPKRKRPRRILMISLLVAIWLCITFSFPSMVFGDENGHCPATMKKLCIERAPVR